MKWYKRVISKYAVFSGRARRREYWIFLLLNAVFSALAGTVDDMLGLRSATYYVGPVLVVYDLFVLIPSIAVSVRRMHDIGRSGAWILISLIPILGWIWYIVLSIRSGDEGSNEYGPDPKTEDV